MNRWLVVSIVLTALALGASLYVVYVRPDSLPAQVPTHWGITGQPDHYVPRDHILPYLLAVPAVMAGMVVLTVLLPWLSPRHFDVERFRDTYHYIMALVVALLAYMHGVILVGSMGAGMNMTRLMLGGLFLFFALLGGVLGKVQRNFWMGVRTPWTLASETVWMRTHRLAGWLFVGGGLAGLVLVLLGAPFLVSLILLLAVALVPVFYSLVLYKSLERQGLLDTRPPSPED
jgi:uncharacterized membrane protein